LVNCTVLGRRILRVPFKKDWVFEKIGRYSLGTIKKKVLESKIAKK